MELGGLADLLRKALEVDEQVEQFPALAELSAMAGCAQDGATLETSVAQIARKYKFHYSPRNYEFFLYKEQRRRHFWVQLV